MWMFVKKQAVTAGVDKPYRIAFPARVVLGMAVSGPDRSRVSTSPDQGCRIFSREQPNGLSIGFCRSEAGLLIKSLMQIHCKFAGRISADMSA